MKRQNQPFIFMNLAISILLLASLAIALQSVNGAEAVQYKTTLYQGLRAENSMVLNPERGWRAEAMFYASNLQNPFSKVEFNGVDRLAKAVKSHGGTVVQTYIYLSD